MLISYLIIRLITLPFAYLPYKAIHAIGRKFGSLVYFLYPKFRKRALSNLALATDLHLSNEEVRRIAKESIQSLMITCLEYAKLAREKNFDKLTILENFEMIEKGTIFFCGHQANWELLFLVGTARMPGVAIGRPIKNHYLYNWIQSIRQKFGGTIIAPKNAIKEGMRSLKNGAFLGIVGDQGMPESSYSSNFLGRLAWTSPIPAMLAYKTNSPIMVAMTHRENGRYRIRLSDPLYPNLDAPKETEIKRLMDKILEIYQESIKAHPGDWLWAHNRWKQQPLTSIKKPYRSDSIALFLPDDPRLLQEISQIRTLYPTEHLALFLPQNCIAQIDAEIHTYTDPQELFRDDLRFKLIVNFTNYKELNKHYEKQSATTTISPKTFAEFQTLVKNA